jgi:hypothetical protein
VLWTQQTETCPASQKFFSFTAIQLADLWPDDQGDPCWNFHRCGLFLAPPTPSNPPEFFLDLVKVSNLSHEDFLQRSSKILDILVNIGFGSDGMEGDTVALFLQVVGSHFMAHGLNIFGWIVVIHHACLPHSRFIAREGAR